MQHQLNTGQSVAGAAQKEPDDKTSKHERRRIIRHQCRVRIEMLIHCESVLSGDRTTNGVEVKGRLLDLSTEGVMLHTKQDFTAGQELLLTILLPGHTVVIATTSVRWCKTMPEKEKEFALRARFRTLSREGKNAIQAFLSELESHSDK